MILLARHGETDWNAVGRVQGSVDEPLNDRGREQARELAAAVAGRGLVAVIASPLCRARETAEIVAAELGLAVSVDARLAESHRGRWQGRLLEDLAGEDPEGWVAWLRAGEGFRFPGGESLGEHAARTAAALDDVSRGPLPAIVVCHGGTIRCALALAEPDGLATYHAVSVPTGGLVPAPRLAWAQVAAAASS